MKARATTYKELSDKYWHYCDRAKACADLYGRNHLFTQYYIFKGKRAYKKLVKIDKSISNTHRPVGNYKAIPNA